jgi:dTMP kinase
MLVSHDVVAESGDPVAPDLFPLFRPSAFRKAGVLIAVEGLDGSGKTTVMETIRSEIVASGREAIVSNWNDASYVYNLSQALTLDGELEPRMRLVLGAAELAARYQYEIIPALERGAVVILNKYVVSAMAHSVVRGHTEALVRKAYRFAVPPDLLLYFDVDPSVALQRKGATKVPGFWESGLDLAVEEPVHEAMRRYSAREMDPGWVRERFCLFQSQLRALQLHELSHWPHVVMVDANRDLDNVVKAARTAVLAIVGDDKEESDVRT